MSEPGFDTEGFSTKPVHGLELIKDWAAFAGVGAYLGATYGYLRLRRKLPAPPVNLPKLTSWVALAEVAKRVGRREGRLEVYAAEGHAYHARGPLGITDKEGVSRLQVFEDGRPLGPGHAPHQEVRELGGGRYSHWGWHLHLATPYTLVMFSTSDNSDPRSNGRSYTYALA